MADLWELITYRSRIWADSTRFNTRDKVYQVAIATRVLHLDHEFDFRAIACGHAGSMADKLTVTSYEPIVFSGVTTSVSLPRLVIKRHSYG